jgi:chemotaxis protein methyltransferase CheR
MACGLSPDRITHYFQAAGSQWRVKDGLRALVNFRKLNLLESLAGYGTFDMIFCRNVAIYFSQADRTRLFERLAKHLHPVLPFSLSMCNEFLLPCAAKKVLKF